MEKTELLKNDLQDLVDFLDSIEGQDVITSVIYLIDDYANVKYDEIIVAQVATDTMRFYSNFFTVKRRIRDIYKNFFEEGGKK